MKLSRLGILILALTVVVFVGLLAGSRGLTNKSSAQTLDKSLDIERYPDEPLELVDLRVGVKSVRAEIKSKSRFRKNEGLDKATFSENADWHKRVSVTLRNVSSQPVIGLRAYLYYKAVGSGQQFRLPLEHTKDLVKKPLAPGDELDIKVGQLWGVITNMIKEQGEDPDLASITLSIEAVMFSDDTQWSRGYLLHRDPYRPNVWKTVDTNNPGASSRTTRPSQFVRTNKPADDVQEPEFSHANQTCPLLAPNSGRRLRLKPPPVDQCVGYGGFVDTVCPESQWCTQFGDESNGYRGEYTRASVAGVCEQRPPIEHAGVTCTTSTTHSRLQFDSSCTPCTYEGIQYYGGSDIDCTLCTDGIDNDCNGVSDSNDGGCSSCQTSPVIVDVDGTGFDLTGSSGGVWFDFFGTGHSLKLSWTSSTSTNAYLVLDRNGNGTIDGGKELFGNLTPQPRSNERNGFLALAEFDKSQNGGNRDGVISRSDNVFSSLRLWQDTNHNGVSEPSELHALPDLSLNSIDLDYKTSKRTDQYGNQFRYRAKVKDANGAQLGRWAWDVFLLSGPGQ